MAASCSLVGKTRLFAKPRADLVAACTARMRGSTARAALRAQRRRACARLSISDTSTTFGFRAATTERIWTLGGQHPAGYGLTKDPSAVKLFRTPFSPHPPRLLLSSPTVDPRSVTMARNLLLGFINWVLMGFLERFILHEQPAVTLKLNRQTLSL